MSAFSRTLIEIAHTLDATTESNARLSRALEMSRQLLRGLRCAVLVETNEGGQRQLIVVPEPPPDTASALREDLGRMLQLGDDAQAPPVARPNPQLRLPLIGLDRVVGILFVERAAPEFSEKELQAFSQVAAQLGAYLTMLRFYERNVELDSFKEEMFAVVVHDLRNPMATVIANLDFVKHATTDQTEDVHEALTDAMSASQRMVRLISNLLDLAKLESNQLVLRRHSIDMGILLEKLARERAARARARSIDLQLSALVEGLRADVDEDLLIRVFANLLDNALRQTPPHGQIELAITRSANWIRITVGNSGPPVPVDARDKIFEKFSQAAGVTRRTMGLGLYFGKLAVEAHGGRIFVEETSTLPAVFVVELPATTAEE